MNIDFYTYKQVDTPIATYTLNSTGQITPLNLIQIGSSFYNRTGRRVELKSIETKGFITAIRTIAGSEYCRIIIVYDKQTNGSPPTTSDILQTTDQTGTNTTTSMSGINPNNIERFIIIKDMLLFLPSLTYNAGVITNAAPTDPITPTFNIEFFIKLEGLITQYKQDSSPSITGDIATGGLFLLTLGNQASGSEGYNATLENRLIYYDD